MKIDPLSVEGAYVVSPRVHADGRGHFFEWFSAKAFTEVVGHDLHVRQANCSVSSKATLRGIHFADVPPGQAKYVGCLSGRVLDVIVDVRVGSPQFGRWEAVVLDQDRHRFIYLAEGLGHGFLALEDNSTVVYLCSTTYNPTAEHEVDPFDPDIAIDWGLSREQASLSDKDAAAPSLREAKAAGLLPDYVACRDYVASLA